MAPTEVLDRNAKQNHPAKPRRTRSPQRNRDHSRPANQPQPPESGEARDVSGIADVFRDKMILRVDSYSPGPDDVAIPAAMVRRYGLRHGDAITGSANGSTLTRLDTVHGNDPEWARTRPEFSKLTALFPQERLRLETGPRQLTNRLIDLVMPIGKGQRALIVSPPKAGKTMVIQSIANAIAQNNPEVHIMVLLIDERPEEVTDMQRSIQGEVIASTFDRPPSEHTGIAELAIERAKRLVELGHDVVLLLDSITRLGRAYNNSAPASGRILTGGIDANALYPPKRLLGAARNIENGGSLTIIASALVETGSTGDTVIFEEFKGTGNAELKLDRKLADRRVFPAIDIDASSTRRDDVILHPDELLAVSRLRKALSASNQSATEQLLDRLAKTQSNAEFLTMLLRGNAS
ncbi:transcription termination factor Rho [Dactylosporangium sp. NPDC049525]|uniref:transcription termination factor Rho n=1 Tax=Dactylosporangium sp. NPDC049525 TaxID=3154730 RepID=UPI003443E5CD